jgi:hypothetical protein
MIDKQNQHHHHMICAYKGCALHFPPVEATSHKSGEAITPEIEKKVYTGHKSARMPDGETLVEWIGATVKDECRFYNVPMPSDKQMAVVISALRMHTIMMHAAEYDISALGQSDKIDPYWPMQGSIGRFFRDAARITLDGSESRNQQEAGGES